MTVMLQLDNVCKSYGALTILEDACASFSKGQKIGVIGRNGAGKSTLCRLITGQEELDSGAISRNSELKLSYLEQLDPFTPEETVMDFLTRYTGREPWRCGEIAGRFQLKNELLEAKIGALAGGFRTRVKLTAMLLQEPNFLVLDEPSNYLDLSTLILLEDFLEDFKGGYLIVSHDREFLKRTCDQTLEVEQGQVTLYPGTIEEYFEFKEEQLKQKLAYNKTVEKKKEQLQAFIDRFGAKASTATRAKSKMKQMARLETIEIGHTSGNVRIRIPPVEPKSGVALLCEDMSIGYPEKLVAGRIHLDVGRGTHVAILGDNGQGKTTLMKTLAGHLEPRAGSYRWGTGLKIAYYAQHIFETLHPADDVFTHLQREAADGLNTQDVLEMAGCFLFKGDDTKKKVTVLSGGERARLCLAGLLLTRSQILLLDEPTNHLDFETVEALGNALKRFEGTVFFISHDRTFVNMLATAIVDIQDGVVSRYPGTYQEYVDHLEMRMREGIDHAKPGHGRGPAQADRAARPEKEAGSPDGFARKPEKPHDEDRKKIHAEIVKTKAKIAKSEKRIENLTREKDEILEEIKNNPFHYSRKRNERLKELGGAIEEEEKIWLGLLQVLEDLKKHRA